MTRRTREEIEKMIVEEYSTSKFTMPIARRFGIADTTVRQILRRNGVVPCHGKTPVGEDRATRMMELFRLGMTTDEIGRGVGCAPGTVSKWLRKQGVPLRPHTKRRKLSVEQRRELARRYESGETFLKLQKAYGVSDSVVELCLDEFQVQTRTPCGAFRTERWLDRRGREHVFKSKWELQYAQRLDELGMNWEYEARKFPLRECRCYTPDFVVYGEDGSEEYHEVKGWLGDAAIARIQEFVREYPGITLCLLGPAEMVAMGIAPEYFGGHVQALRVEALREWIEDMRRFHGRVCA
jgi:transposase-like protein